MGISDRREEAYLLVSRSDETRRAPVSAVRDCKERTAGGSNPMVAYDRRDNAADDGFSGVSVCHAGEKRGYSHF